MVGLDGRVAGSDGRGLARIAEWLVRTGERYSSVVGSDGQVIGAAGRVFGSDGQGLTRMAVWLVRTAKG